jgi:hypothetical protein
MERKAFLSTAAGIGGILAAASAALAAPDAAAVPIATMVPRPGATPWRRNGQWSNQNIHNIRIRLETVIDQLSHDQHDYDGHRARALQLCQQARQELLLAEHADPNK